MKISERRAAVIIRSSLPLVIVIAFTRAENIGSIRQTLLPRRWRREYEASLLISIILRFLLFVSKVNYLIHNPHLPSHPTDLLWKTRYIILNHMHFEQ